MKSIKDRAANGLGYLYGKFFYGNVQETNNNSNSNDRYSSNSNSSYYNNEPSEEEDDGSYVKMNDNKKESLLEKNYKNY